MDRVVGRVVGLVDLVDFVRLAGFVRLAVVGVFAVVALIAAPASAAAGVVVTVDKTTQRLTVAVDGAVRHVWPTSTARFGYTTPNGVYRPQRLERQWYSRKYDWSPMPYSIFFHGGYAIHGSYEISRLGRPASHGCIRLRPSHAALLFDLVRRNRADTTIVVTGHRPSRAPLVAGREPPPRAAQARRRAAPEPRYYVEEPREHVERRYYDDDGGFAGVFRPWGAPIDPYAPYWRVR